MNRSKGSKIPILRNYDSGALEEKIRDLITSFIPSDQPQSANMDSVSSTSQLTSNTSPVAENQDDQQSHLTTTNTALDLEGFLPGLEAIICGRGDIDRGIPIGQVRSDPEPKRIVLAFFNEGGVIMRRVVDYDSQGRQIKAKDSRYKIYKGASLTTKDIIYRKGWEGITKAEEGKKVFDAMASKGWTKGWGFRSFEHMRKTKHTRAMMAMAKKRKASAAEDDIYREFRGFKTGRVSTTTLRGQMDNANQTIQPLARQLNDLAILSTRAGQKETRELGDEFAEALARLNDEITLIMGTFQEGITEWRT